VRYAIAALVALSAFCLLAHLVACGGLTPAEQQHVAHTATVIASCQDIGRACKADGGTGCYGEYSACMRDGGL
jgi:hypothetical protein